jgi:hypothetical protein
MIQGYYEARGWDDRGFVPEKKLRDLGIAGTEGVESFQSDHPQVGDPYAHR